MVYRVKSELAAFFIYMKKNWSPLMVNGIEEYIEVSMVSCATSFKNEDGFPPVRSEYDNVNCLNGSRIISRTRKTNQYKSPDILQHLVILANLARAYVGLTTHALTETFIISRNYF